MANEPVLGTTLIGAVALVKNGENQYVPKRLTADDSYDPPRLLVHTLGTMNMGLGSVYTEAMSYNGNLIEYHGWAAPGASKAAAVWAVVKYTYSGNLITDITWAGGLASFNQVWNDRASLSYS